tara:strand:- start:643 stop:1434 length:792 start_codon:yes stop_codon:yes gene_type:complete
MVFTIQGTEINIMQNHFINNFNYKTVYISIGSKFNKPNTNAIEQMTPSFLQSNPNNNTLIIIIDDFTNVNSYQTNLNYINTLDSTFSNFTYYVINQLCNPKFLLSFLNIILPYVNKNNISSNNFMIVNYVCFINQPNPSEKNSEHIIPTIIQKFLNNYETDIYNSSFYQWFGYNKVLYNYIYNYKIIYFPHILPNYMKMIQDIIINANRYSDEIISIVIQNPFIIRVLKNIYDITQPNINFHNFIAISKYVDCIENNTIIDLL